MVNVAEYVFGFLAAQGIDTAFILTGNGAMQLNDALERQEGISYICARNEAAAPVMAAGYARVTGKPGVVSITSGPGATNTLPGLAECWVDSTPVIIIAGQSPRNELPEALGVENLRTFGTAGIDIVPIVKKFTKYAVTLSDAHSVHEVLRTAFIQATTGRPGPVWIDIPMDVQASEVSGPVDYSVTIPDTSHDCCDDDINKLFDLIQQSKRPLILGGQGIRQGGVVSEFEKLIESLEIPVGLSRLGQDLLPRSHRLNLGQLGRRGALRSREILGEADLIIALGCRMAVQLAGAELSHFSPSAKVAMVDIDGDEIAKFGSRISLGAVANLRTFVPEMLRHRRKINTENWKDWSAQVLAGKGTVPNFSSSFDDGIDLYEFMSQLDRMAPAGSLFVTDAGSNYYVGGQVFRFEQATKEITSGSYAAMGISLPLAIGAASSRKLDNILAVTGDGSLELNIQELKTLSYYGLPVKLFVINNGGYVSMRNWQDNFFDGRRIGSDAATGAEMLSLASVAETFGLPFRRIHNSLPLEGQIQSVIDEQGPILTEVICTPSQKITQPFLDGELSS